MNRIRATPSDGSPRVRVHLTSIDTSAATELCIRTARRFAGHPFELVVGDSGSTDGSLEMLESFQQQGWLKLEVAPQGRRHAKWLDSWLAACDAEYAVFVDSDVEFLRHGWLRDLVVTARQRAADLVCAEVVPEQRNFREPSPRRLTVRLMARPSHWLVLVSASSVARLGSSFAYHEEPAPPGSESLLAFDVGGRLWRDALDRGLSCAAMPGAYTAKYHHYGGLSWPATARDYGFDTDPYGDLLAKSHEIDRRLSLVRGANP